MGRVTNIDSDEAFPPALAAAGNNLVVVDFYADWWG
jgi:thiol:disulfide interchange protein